MFVFVIYPIWSGIAGMFYGRKKEDDASFWPRMHAVNPRRILFFSFFFEIYYNTTLHVFLCQISPHFFNRAGLFSLFWDGNFFWTNEFLFFWQRCCTECKTYLVSLKQNRLDWPYPLLGRWGPKKFESKSIDWGIDS